MALTQIADVVVPEIFGPYTANLAITTSNLITSSIVMLDGTLSSSLQAGGTTFNMPSWAAPDMETEYQTPTDDNVLIVPVKSVAINEIAVRLGGNEAYSSARLAAQLAGSNPMDALASHIAGIMGGKRQTMLINQLNGLFDTALAASVSDIAVEAIASYTAATVFGSGVFIDALAPFSDMLGDNYSIVCHPDVYRAMMKEGLIDTDNVSVTDGSAAVNTYLGFPVVRDARCPKVAGATDGFKYTTYVAAPGAIRTGAGSVGVVVDNNELAGNGSGVENLIVRDSFGFHVGGTKWTGTAAGALPTAAELATGGNWAKVLDTKLIPVAAIITNVAV